MQVYVNLFDLLSPLGCKPEEGARNGMFPANPPKEQRGLLAHHAPLPAACLPALLPRGWGKNASCCISAPLMELQTPGFVSGCRHLDAFCDAVLAQVPSCNSRRGSVSPLPPVFPRMFLPSPCPSACLARSLSLPTSAQFPLLQPRGISHAGSQRVTPVPRARSHSPGAVGPLSSP